MDAAGGGSSVAKGWSRSSGCCLFLALLPKDCAEPHRLPAANISSVTQCCALIPRYVFCQALSELPTSPPCQRPQFSLCACGDTLLFTISRQHPALCMTPLSFPYPSFVYQVFSTYWQVTLLPPSTPAVPGGFLQSSLWRQVNHRLRRKQRLRFVSCRAVFHLALVTAF